MSRFPRIIVIHRFLLLTQKQTLSLLNRFPLSINFIHFFYSDFLLFFFLSSVCGVIYFTHNSLFSLYSFLFSFLQPFMFIIILQTNVTSSKSLSTFNKFHTHFTYNHFILSFICLQCHILSYPFLFSLFFLLCFLSSYYQPKQAVFGAANNSSKQFAEGSLGRVWHTDIVGSDFNGAAYKRESVLDICVGRKAYVRYCHIFSVCPLIEERKRDMLSFFFFFF